MRSCLCVRVSVMACVHACGVCALLQRHVQGCPVGGTPSGGGSTRHPPLRCCPAGSSGHGGSSCVVLTSELTGHGSSLCPSPVPGTSGSAQAPRWQDAWHTARECNGVAWGCAGPGLGFRGVLLLRQGGLARAVPVGLAPSTRLVPGRLAWLMGTTRVHLGPQARLVAGAGPGLLGRHQQGEAHAGAAQARHAARFWMHLP